MFTVFLIWEILKSVAVDLAIFSIYDDFFIEGLWRYDVLHSPHKLEPILIYLLNMTNCGLAHSAFLVILLHESTHNFIKTELVNVFHVHVGLFLEGLYSCWEHIVCIQSH